MVERNMCNAVMRGIVVPPGSKSTSRANGSRRNLGYLASGRQLRVRSAYGGPHREGEEPYLRWEPYAGKRTYGSVRGVRGNSHPYRAETGRNPS